MPYPGESPVVSGGKELQVAWEAHDVANGKNIWKADISGQVADVPGLQLDGVRATRARYPNLPGGIEVSPGYDAMISENDATWTPPQFDRFGNVTFFTDARPEFESAARERRRRPRVRFNRVLGRPGPRRRRRAGPGVAVCRGVQLRDFYDNRAAAARG